MHGNILHKPLPNNDPKWNGTAFVITTDIGNAKNLIVKNNTGRDYYVSLIILSNAVSDLHTASLVGILRDDSFSTGNVEILRNLSYFVRSDKSKTIYVTIPMDDLNKLSRNYNLILEVNNAVGRSQFPLVITSDNDRSPDNIEDRDIVLWILLPFSLVIVVTAICILICKAYRYRV